MLGLMMAASWGNKEAESKARKIWLKLSGIADPATVNKKGMSPYEIKQGMHGLT